MEYRIYNKPEINRLEAITDDKIIGLIDYHITPDKTIMTVTHTEVNKEYEGMGIAATMTKALLDYAREKQLKIVPLCSYTRMYFERHSEYHGLLA